MYNKILAPMDGSKLSECSLEHVAAIASGCHSSKVILLTVMRPIILPGEAWSISAKQNEILNAEIQKEEAQMQEEEFCIRCGACVRECPSGLMPCLINLAAQKELWAEAKNYGAIDCIECGVCSYVCPANRRLVQSIKRAKFELAI